MPQEADPAVPLTCFLVNAGAFFPSFSQLKEQSIQNSASVNLRFFSLKTGCCNTATFLI
jgi:hypothetical protein